MSRESFHRRSKGHETLQDKIAARGEYARDYLHGFLERLKRRVGLINAITWQKEGFDLKQELRGRKGPFIEVAGPTIQGYDMVPPKLLREHKDHTFVSNVDDGLYYSVPVMTADSEDAKWRDLKVASVDFSADATRLPFADASIGAIFASCLQRETRKGAIHEAARVLEPGGLLIWQASFKEDFASAAEAGLSLASYEWELEPELMADIKETNDLQKMVEDVRAARLHLRRKVLKERGMSDGEIDLQPEDELFTETKPDNAIFKKITEHS